MLKKNILVVEDEPDLLDLISELLGMEGYQVFRAGSSMEALEIWKTNSEKIDLLFTDLTLPEGATGVALAKKFQDEKPSLKLLYSSGHTAEMVAHKFAVPRDANFLQKPFQPAALEQAVRNALSA